MSISPAVVSTVTWVPSATLLPAVSFTVAVIVVLATPFAFLSERYKRLGLSGSRSQRAKDALLDKRYVKEHAIPRRGRPPILLEPLRSLCEALQQPNPTWGKGSFKHAFGIYVACKALKARDFTRIEKEKFYNGKAVDAVGTSPEGTAP